MMVLILERVSESLRGELTRWLHEPRTGVFVGRTSAKVRSLLWQRVTTSLGPQSGALLLHQSEDEPGFHIRSHGDTTRRIQTYDGLQLIQRDHPNHERALKKLAARLPKGERKPFDPSKPPGGSDDEEQTRAIPENEPNEPSAPPA